MADGAGQELTLCMWKWVETNGLLFRSVVFNLWLTTPGGAHIRYPVSQIFTIQLIAVAKIPLWSSKENYCWTTGLDVLYTQDILKENPLPVKCDKRDYNLSNLLYKINLRDSPTCHSSIVYNESGFTDNRTVLFWGYGIRNEKLRLAMSCGAISPGEDRCPLFSLKILTGFLVLSIQLLAMPGQPEVNAVLPLALHRSQLKKKRQLVFVLCAARDRKKHGMTVR